TASRCASISRMPQYFFRIRNGRFTGASDQGTECADHGAAWKEMTNFCADMAGGILRKLTQNAEWQLELLDETKEPGFRIRIVAESLARSRRSREDPGETQPLAPGSADTFAADFALAASGGAAAPARSSLAL